MERAEKTCALFGVGFWLRTGARPFGFLIRGQGKRSLLLSAEGDAVRVSGRSSAWVCLGDAVPLFTPQNVSCSQQSWSEQMQFLFGGVPP